jgi:hypothetical protein
MASSCFHSTGLFGVGSPASTTMRFSTTTMECPLGAGGTPMSWNAYQRCPTMSKVASSLRSSLPRRSQAFAQTGTSCHPPRPPSGPRARPVCGRQRRCPPLHVSPHVIRCTSGWCLCRRSQC